VPGEQLRRRTALNLGELIAGGFIAVKSQATPQVKNIGANVFWGSRPPVR
jgi:hypothetical protein